MLTAEGALARFRALTSPMPPGPTPAPPKPIMPPPPMIPDGIIAEGPDTLVLEADLSFFLRKKRLLRSFFRRRFRWSSSSTEFGLSRYEED